jgi:hypothetical protein
MDQELQRIAADAVVGVADPEEAKSSRLRALGRENAKWRTQFRAADEELTTLRARLAELEAQLGQGDTPTEPPAEAPIAAADVAPIADEPVDEPADEDEIEFQRARDEMSEGLLHKRLKDAGAMYPAETAAILRDRQQVVIDARGESAILIDGQAHPISRETLSAVLQPAFMRTEGAPGAGSKPGGRGAGPVGLDMERALGSGDLDYFDKHEKAIRQEMRRRGFK